MQFIKKTLIRPRKKTMLRLFVGLELPANITDELNKLCSGLRDVRWVEAHNMHITLSFIGEVDEGTAEELHEALCQIQFDPFTLSLEEMGCFETRGAPKVIWADVKGEVDTLTRLHHKVLNAVSNAGLKPERRKYKPHVTVARLRATTNERIFDYLESHNGLKTNPFTCRHFSLYQSHLTRHGPEYEVLERYEF